MKPMYFEVDDHLPLIVVPESDAHMDGHPVLTYSYAIFKKNENPFDMPAAADKLLAADKVSNPDYLGKLIFEYPGKLFTYEAGKVSQLGEGEISELIEKITAYRENPSQWRL